jgi:chondroitin AC lyase
MMKKAILLLFLFLFSTWIVSGSIINDDISIVHQRVLDWMILPSKENITFIVQNATVYHRTLNSSCYWEDVMYNDTRLTHWRTIEHLYRITTMLQAVTVNGSKVQNDPEILVSVHCALNVWLLNDWQAPNWFHNEINVPTFVTGQLLMLGNNATSFQTDKIKEISFRSAWWLNRPRDVGANLVSMIQIQLYRSLATNNVTGIEQGFRRMWEDIAIQSANNEGIQYDWSYHFHGTQLLSGAYGQAWAHNIFAFIACSDQTKYAVKEEELSTFVQFITKGSAWMIVGKEWDWNVMGRAVSRPDEEYYVLFYTKFIRIVAELVELNDTKVQLLNLANRLDGQSNASLLIGNAHFFVSDYQVHRRANWTSAIKMQSIRTQSIECINDEDQKAEHSGQGVLNLYTIDTYDYDNIFPLLDWKALNGITVEHDIPLEPCKNGAFPWKNVSFVGGVSNEQYGLAMMDTASHNLTAKRSWHFYDDAIIALATNLTLKTLTTAWTTLASRLLATGKITVGFFNSTVITLSDGDYSFTYIQGETSNVQWIHLGNSDIGYLLQSQQQYASLGIQLGIKTGNYFDIGPFNFTVTARVLTIWINHGLGPYTLDYNYMILPNVSLESMPTIIRQYADEQVFSCVSTNNWFHGTMWPALKRASFVLWENITTTFSCKSSLFQINIELSDAGAYLFTETETDFTVTASHPTRTTGNLKVTVDRLGSGQACSPLWKDNEQKTDVTLTLPSAKDLLGASVSIRCAMLSSSAFLHRLPFFVYSSSVLLLRLYIWGL